MFPYFRLYTSTTTIITTYILSCNSILFILLLYFTETPKSNNMILYIGSKLHFTDKYENYFCVLVAVGIIILVIILLCCCFGGGLLLWQSENASKAPIRPSRSHRRHTRASIDSTASDATY